MILSNPINFKYIARITLKNPYANVLTILVHRSNLPSIDIHSTRSYFSIFSFFKQEKLTTLANTNQTMDIMLELQS